MIIYFQALFRFATSFRQKIKPQVSIISKNDIFSLALGIC